MRFEFLPEAEKEFREAVRDYKKEEAESHPMVVTGYGLTDGQTCCPADYGHGGLKKAEVPGQAKILAQADTAQFDARGNGHGKSVHCQGHGNGDNIEQPQGTLQVNAVGTRRFL